jgi:hypothetical protein
LSVMSGTMCCPCLLPVSKLLKIRMTLTTGLQLLLWTDTSQTLLPALLQSSSCQCLWYSSEVDPVYWQGMPNSTTIWYTVNTSISTKCHWHGKWQRGVHNQGKEGSGNPSHSSVLCHAHSRCSTSHYTLLTERWRLSGWLQWHPSDKKTTISKKIWLKHGVKHST